MAITPTKTEKQAESELIARLEAASEGSIDLDREIEAYLFPQHRTLIFRDKWNLPPRTRSLDAALTLVPEGWFWRVGRTSIFQAWAGVHQTHPDHGEPNRNEFYWHREHGGPPSTPAIALCIAALKARAA